MENLKTIYDIQETIGETFDQINQGKLLHAHKQLNCSRFYCFYICEYFFGFLV